MIFLPVFLAVAIGLIVGVLGRLTTRRRTTASGPVTVAVAVSAALLGIAGAELTGSTAFGRVALPTLMAVVAVGLIIMVRPRRDTPR